MSQELSIKEKIQAPIIHYSESFDKKLKGFEERLGGIVYDMKTEEGRKQARADRREINTKFIKPLDDTHKEIKEPVLNASRMIDSARKELKDRAIILADNAGNQIKEYDNMLQAKIDNIESLLQFDDEPSSSAVDARVTECNGIVIDDSYGDKQPDAALLKEKTLASLRELHQKALDREELIRLKEAEQVRLAKEREEQIRIEAEEQAAKAAKEAAAKAERDKEEAVKNAQAQAQAKIDEANKEKAQAELKAKEAAKAERDKIEAASLKEKQKQEELLAQETAKKAKQEHRAKIHKSAKASFVKAGFNEVDAGKIVTLIKDGLIDNVSVDY